MKQGFSIFLLLLSLQFAFSPLHAHAALTLENPISDKLGGTDLRTTVINTIKLALGFLALIAVVMIIFSGIVAATAEGDRAEAARRTIVGALIGLVIVILAWAVVSFVGNTAKNVTA